jgi:hypothetical protein
MDMGDDDVAALAASMAERYGDRAADVADMFAQTERGEEGEFWRKVAAEIRAMERE